MTTYRVEHPDAEGTPIVMIHGVGDSIDSWAAVVSRLSADRPYLTFTLRGHETQAANPAPPYVIEDFVSDLFELVDRCGFSRVILAGFSLGGLIAQAATLTRPERVVGVIAVGSVAGRTDEERERVLERHRQVRTTSPLEVAGRSVDRWYSPDYLAAHPEAREQTLARMAELDPDCYAAAYHVLATNDFVDDLHRIAVPVLAIAGAHDVGSPPHMAERIASSVQNGTAVTVPDVKHQLLQETPDVIAKEIDSFVRIHQI